MYKVVVYALAERADALLLPLSTLSIYVLCGDKSRRTGIRERIGYTLLGQKGKGDGMERKR
jgi:hypothetical protein